MKSFLRMLGLVLLVILIGTGIDWIVHSLDVEYAVPGYYYRNKIFYGTVLGMGALLLARHFTRNTRWLAFWTSLLVALLLQTRYFLEGYPLDFVFLFMLVHGVAFFVPAWFLFRKLP